MCDEKVPTLRFAPIFDKRQLQGFVLYMVSKFKDIFHHKINKFSKKQPPSPVMMSYPVKPKGSKCKYLHLD